MLLHKFESAAEQLSEFELSLHNAVITSPHSTIGLTVEDDKHHYNVKKNDLLIVDISLHPTKNDLIATHSNDEVLIGRYSELNNHDTEHNFGVVTAIITPLRKFNAQLNTNHEWLDSDITIDSLMINNPTASFFVRAHGNNLISHGIEDNCILCINRSLEITDNDIVLAIVNGEFVCREISSDRTHLLGNSGNQKAISLKDCEQFSIEGIVTAAIKLPRYHNELSHAGGNN